MAYVLGVDVGTTYTAAAVDASGRTEIFQLGSRAASIPSVVVLRADGEVLTGETADRRSQTEPARTAREFKRRLGDPVPMILGGTPYGAEALYAHMLRGVVAQVTEQRGEAPGLVVITHPASYGPYKLDLLRQAVRQAEIGEAVLLSEPEAAAIHYADQERLEPGAVVAVYDFGGGTFDAAVLRKTGDGFELLGEAEGLERLGGIDFDQAVLGLVNSATSGALDSLDQSDPAGRAAANRLRDECRQTKEALSSDTEGVIPVLLPSLQTEVRLTREEFEEMVRPRLKETIAALERAVRSAGLTFAEVDRILLVGGSSRIPVVGALVREATSRPTAIDAHPKHAIALGAAIYGREMLGKAPVRAAAPPAPAPAPAPLSSTEPEMDELLPPPPPPPPPPQVVAPAGAMALAGPAPAAPEAATGTAGNGRPRPPLAAIGGAAAAIVVIGAAAAFLLTRSGGNGNAADRNDDQGQAAATTPAGAAAVTATESPSPNASATGQVTASATTPATQTTAAGATAAGGGAATVAPTATPSPTTAPTLAPTAAATPTATSAPASASITGITIADGKYQVSYVTSGFTPALSGRHLHFYFSSSSPAAGSEYAGGSPFTDYAVADRPQAAQQMCIVVVNADHTVVSGTGNCVNLPAQGGYY